MGLDIPLSNFFEMGFKAGSIGDQLAPTLQHNADMQIQQLPAYAKAHTDLAELPSNIAYKEASARKLGIESNILTDPKAREHEINAKMFEQYYLALGKLPAIAAEKAGPDAALQRKLFVKMKNQLDTAFGMGGSSERTQLKDRIFEKLAEFGKTSSQGPVALGKGLAGLVV